MVKENYLDLFDFQGTDKEKEELKTYVEGLSELPTGKKILNQVQESSIRKPIPLKYGTFTEEWAGASWNNKEKSITYSNNEHLNEASKEDYWWKLNKNISALGHELTHGLFANLSDNISENLTICQKLYRELCDEAIAYINTGHINYDFIMAHMNDSSEFERFKNVKRPTKEVDKAYFINFIQDRLEKGKFHYNSPSNYVDKVIRENGGKGIHSSSSLTDEVYLQYLGKIMAYFFGEEIKIPPMKESRWFAWSKNGGYHIIGKKRMMSFDNKEHPLFSSLYDEKKFKTRFYSRTYEEQEGKLIPVDCGDIAYYRPPLDEEATELGEALKSGKIIFRKLKTPCFESFHDFIEWQNRQQISVAIQQNLQNPRG